MLPPALRTVSPTRRTPIVAAFAVVGAMYLIIIAWPLIFGATPFDEFLALVVLGYTIFRNVVPYPTGAAAWLPVVCAVWLLAAVVGVMLRPELARRVGERLTSEEGLSATTEETTP